ncbi:response regulator [Sphingomonas piscis]|uniref:histidine kinase n=1 Tax=Sphingomonas piscis TaxID=2714943 RepID=A0A6G7YRG7_9SPHN|nr:response regulator [Sphingomonas piscis]QIK79329.1 response regulator [Sphingomonas piscis]
MDARRVLYVDDDDGLRRLVERLLGRRGYDVVTAATGGQALDLVRAEPFDLVAVDHYMPEMDGLSTLTAIHQAVPGLPVVYVTGSEESSVAVAALKAGAAEYVVKSAGGDFVDLLEKAFDQALSKAKLERQKAEAEEALRISNERLHTLLREVNHRVANSLQLVSTMVGMQSRILTDEAARDALGDTQRRIDAIAQVHRNLYASDDVQSVAMDEYLAVLVRELEQTWSTEAAPRPIRLQAEPVRLQAEKALSLGVIVNELVTNACKYAYGEGVPGEVRIHFAREHSDGFRLTVEDDGCGMSLTDSPRGTGLGSKLITAMAKSLATSVTYDRAHKGVRASLSAAL